MVILKLIGKLSAVRGLHIPLLAIGCLNLDTDIGGNLGCGSQHAICGLFLGCGLYSSYIVANILKGGRYLYRVSTVLWPAVHVGTTIFNCRGATATARPTECRLKYTVFTP